jgi:hypothetical protein
MAEDPTISWQLANPSGIQIDAAADAWHSGHVTEILRLDDADSLLVATQTGGVWSVDANSDALPLSDSWDRPQVPHTIAQ